MAGDLSAKKSDFVTNWIQNIDTILETVAEMQRQQLEATVLNYAQDITDEDLVDGNAHLTKAALGASLQSFNALKVFFEANNNAHYAAFYRVVR